MSTRRTRKHPYSWCEKEILEKVIAPKLLGLIRHTTHSTKQDLLAAFNEQIEGSDSFITMDDLNHWLKALDLEPERMLVFPGEIVTAERGAVLELIDQGDTDAAALENLDLPEGVSEAPVNPSSPRGVPVGPARVRTRGMPALGPGGIQV